MTPLLGSEAILHLDVLFVGGGGRLSLRRRAGLWDPLRDPLWILGIFLPIFVADLFANQSGSGRDQVGFL